MEYFRPVYLNQSTIFARRQRSCERKEKAGGNYQRKWEGGAERNHLLNWGKASGYIKMSQSIGGMGATDNKERGRGIDWEKNGVDARNALFFYFEMVSTITCSAKDWVIKFPI